MKNFKLSLLATLALVSASMATTILPGSEQSLQSVLNSITTGGVSSVNVNTDQVNPDLYWALTATGTSAATMIIEIAGNAASNTMGLYDLADPTKRVTLFNGAATGGSKVAVTVDAAFNFKVIDLAVPALLSSNTFSGSNFGYFMTGGGNTFYSDYMLNEGTNDHMVAYAGKGDIVTIPGNLPSTWTPDEYILAWEDLPLGSSDRDYNDMVVMVESVKPVPEPTTIGLMGLGILGLAFGARRRKV